MNNIIVFTLNGCGHCVDLKKTLIELEIDYSEIVIDDNEEIWNQIVNQTGHNSLPTIFVSINGTDEGPVFVPERDFNSKDECIDIIKKYV